MDLKKIMVNSYVQISRGSNSFCIKYMICTYLRMKLQLVFIDIEPLEWLINHDTSYAKDDKNLVLVKSGESRNDSSQFGWSAFPPSLLIGRPVQSIHRSNSCSEVYLFEIHVTSYDMWHAIIHPPTILIKMLKLTF